MLIRFAIENMFSFDERREFTTIANKRLKTLQEHKYEVSNIEILKMSSIYGANGAGKSNLIKSLSHLKKMVSGKEVPYNLKGTRYKFGDQKEQIFAIEFIEDGTALYYGMILSENIISTEELYLSGLGKSEDKLIFERKTVGESTSIKFSDDFENDEKSQVLKTVLLEEFVKPNKPVLKLLSNRDNKFLKDVKKAYQWFSETLEIITPDSKPSALAHKIDTDIEFKKYAKDLMCSFNIGITSLGTEKKNIRDFFGEDNETELEKLIKTVEDSPYKMVRLTANRDEEIILVKEHETIWVKTLKVEHSSSNNSAFFELNEESDGTVRLLDFVPAFKNVITSEKVYIIDEIERSIHPLLIKELIKKFSLDSKTCGQLIFTTHESNLLDQEIFRQDEIWFAEKDMDGATDLYSLSDFKEHKTIDIRKGYLNGRYGSIPFLGNLEDLKWHDYDFDK